MAQPERTLADVAFSETFGGFAMWPDNLEWSFQFVRVVSQAVVGGGDFTEVFHAARTIEPRSADSWYDAFHGLAADLEAKAEEAAKGGHRVTARDLWFRASNYYRNAGFFLEMSDQRWLNGVDERRRCFQSAAPLAKPVLTPVEIPYEGDFTLPGYLVRPETDGPKAGIVVWGGGDAQAEEMYFHIGKALVERGITVLLFDGPGQGESYRRGLRARHDWEVPTGAAIDYLLANTDVDPERVGVVSESMGGYYAARATAFEPRIKASVVWGGVYEFPLVLLKHPRIGPYLADLVGAADLDEAREKLSKFTLAGDLHRIACPVLVMAGGAEEGFLRRPGQTDAPVPHLERIFDEIGDDRKTLKVFPAGTPGCSHCQLDSVQIAHREIGDWLEDVFGLVSPA